MDITALAESLASVVRDLPKAHILHYAYILYTLKLYKGHRAKSAAALGICRRTITTKIDEMRALGVEIPPPSNSRQ